MSKECPLYETQFGAAQVFQQVHELGDIQGFYKAFGVDTLMLRGNAVTMSALSWSLCIFCSTSRHMPWKTTAMKDSDARRCAKEVFERASWEVGASFCSSLRKKGGRRFLRCFISLDKRIHAIGNAINGY